MKLAASLPWALLALALPCPCLAQHRLFELVAWDHPNEYGSSVAIDAGRVVVGASADSVNGSASGSAYFFDFTGALALKVTPSDGNKSDRFGWSVAVSFDRAVVGAPNAQTPRTGAAYVFDIQTGQELHKLTATDGVVDDEFGWSVAISGNRLVVGARRDDLYTGSAYIFDVATGQELHKLIAGDGTQDDYFGRSVSISGDRAIIGAWGDDDLGSESGSAYIFDVVTGQQLHKLTASDGGPGGYFGDSVAISGDRAVIGAYGAAAAYVFDVATGQELFKVTNTDGLPTFGRSVAIGKDRVVVGARNDPVYIFGLATGQELYKLDGTGQDVVPSFVVAASGDRVIVGQQDWASAAFVFDVSQKIGGTYCWSWPNSTGEVGAIFASGDDSAQANDLRLTAIRLPANKIGYFINSPKQGFTAFPGGSQGNLCLGAPIGRHSKQVSGTGLGFIQVSIDLTQLPTPNGTHSVLAGETWNWQCWYRDFNQNQTSNFTYASSVTFQ